MHTWRSEHLIHLNNIVAVPVTETCAFARQDAMHVDALRSIFAAQCSNGTAEIGADAGSRPQNDFTSKYIHSLGQL